MFLHVDDVVYAGGYRLRVTFNDGVIKEVDLHAELSGPVFKPLKDVQFFREVRLNQDTGTVEWPNGADFAPEFLSEIGTPVSATMARKVAEDQAEYDTGVPLSLDSLKP
jgi:hypothetical protein